MTSLSRPVLSLWISKHHTTPSFPTRRILTVFSSNSILQLHCTLLRRIRNCSTEPFFWESMSGGIARARLAEERKSWRKNHPHGFVAKPKTLPDGTVDLMVWDCVIPGKAGTAWEGGNYPLTVHFSEDYPSKPPRCLFPLDFFHLNVYPCGSVCLSILNEQSGWRPAITVKQILIGIQDLLDQPNAASAAQGHSIFTKDFAEYERRVSQQAKQYPPPPA